MIQRKRLLRRNATPQTKPLQNMMQAPYVLGGPAPPGVTHSVNKPQQQERDPLLDAYGRVSQLVGVYRTAPNLANKISAALTLHTTAIALAEATKTAVAKLRSPPVATAATPTRKKLMPRNTRRKLKRRT